MVKAKKCIIASFIGARRRKAERRIFSPQKSSAECSTVQGELLWWQRPLLLALFKISEIL
jgi:hypothetical protein